MTKEPCKRPTIRIPESLDKQITDYAKQMKISKNAAIVRAISEFIHNLPKSSQL